jgi:hypothetical protein
MAEESDPFAGLFSEEDEVSQSRASASAVRSRRGPEGLRGAAIPLGLRGVESGGGGRSCAAAYPGLGECGPEAAGSPTSDTGERSDAAVEDRSNVSFWKLFDSAP